MNKPRKAGKEFRSNLEKSFAELVNEEFVENLFTNKGDAKAHLIHEVKNMSYHTGFFNIFNFIWMDGDNKVSIVDNAMPNYRDWWCPGEIGWGEDFPTPSLLPALVIPIKKGVGIAEHIKICISVDEHFRHQYAVRFQVRGSKETSFVRVTPKNVFQVILTLNSPE